MAENDEYELLPKHELETLKKEVERLKKHPLGDLKEGETLLDAVNNLNNSVRKLIDIFTKAEADLAKQYAEEAVYLAGKANCGKISIRDLKALGTKYDGRIVEISGEIRDIETTEGMGYKVMVDDGTGIIVVYFTTNDEYDMKHKIINKDPNQDILYLDYDNYSQSYQGKIGPMYDNYGESVKGAEVVLVINDDKYFGKTDAEGNSTLMIPQDIIESINLEQKYLIEITKEHYYDLSWKVKIIIIED